jgi:putative PIN family toxin of toxin-antitoxin system
MLRMPSPKSVAGVPKVVLDTNVIVSAVISDRGPSRRLLELWQAGKFEVVTCPGQIEEVGRVLRYDRIRLRYRLASEDIRSVLALLQTQTQLAEDPTPVPRVTGDAGDDLLLALVEVSKADCLVTGDRPLAGVASAAFRIVSPRRFLEELAE